MGTIAWTQESENWLRDIHDYIAQDSPDAAERVMVGILDRALILKKFPKYIDTLKIYKKN